jgi:phospholipid/cholesterol/gamma-HCH transport system ATP-binding protein
MENRPPIQPGDNDLRSSARETEDGDGPPIQLEKLHYSINGDAILDGVDLTVQRGEIVAIMGRSGTGKTTVLRLIMGLIRPTSGSIRIRGTEITALAEEELGAVRANMGMVFQGAALFDSMTVGENVAFGLLEHRRLPVAEVTGRVHELLEMVDMAGTEDLLPAQLSGGMRKRVGIARALALEPCIMLYDEPTAGLDPISAAATDALITRLRDRVGVTTLIVSHDVQSLRRISDRAAVLHRGRFLAVAPMSELERTSDEAISQFLSGSPDGPLSDKAGQ